jgi:hypothetical protein
MNKTMDIGDTANLLAALLVDRYISRVTYYITGWELFIVLENGNEIRICTAEVRIPEQKHWLTHLAASPFDLQEGNEPEDTASAIVVFNVINSFPITDVRIYNEGTLELQFATGRSILFPGIVKGVDWTWQVDRNGTNLVTCDSGSLFGHPGFIKE